MAAENTDTDTSVKFTIGDEEYEMPDFLDLDLDEWAFVYDVSGVVLEDFSPISENPKLKITKAAAARMEKQRQEKLRHPNVLKAFACVGYRRAKPDADPDEVQDVVGRVKMLPFLESMAEEDDADPTSASEQERSSPRSEDASSASSSSASPASSDELEGELATTGTGG